VGVRPVVETFRRRALTHGSAASEPTEDVHAEPRSKVVERTSAKISPVSDSSAYFATRFTPEPARAKVWSAVCLYLQRWVPADGAVLDLGAGYGDFSMHIVAARRVAFDANPDLRHMLPPSIEAEVGDAQDLSRFADQTFDAVFASNLLEHLTWEQLDEALPEIRRVLRPGGRLILVQPNFRLRPREYFDDYTHRTIFSDRSLPDFLNASGFRASHVEPRFLPLTMKSRLSFGHALVPLYLRLPYRPLAGQMLVVAERS
jgi:SAM-dependent methyltransferase